MNRMEELRELEDQLEQSLPPLEETMARAEARLRRRNRRISRAVSSLCAVFALFVVLVNFCAPVAYACSKVPGLRELAEAVTFSRSLTDAVKNEYVQPISLEQSQNNITASVEYLIVDQKQVNVFFRLNGEGYETLDAEVDFTHPDETRLGSCTFGANDTDVLEFDPTFTAKAKVYPVNQTVELEGKHITIRQVEVYPTHLRVEVEEHEDNDAWLRGLDFHIETDWGMKFETESNGTVSFRFDGSNVTTYRADSTYFYKANRLRMVITGAEWLNKDMETTYVNLVTGETGPLPDGVSFVAAEKKEGGWLVTFKARERRDAHSHQLFDLTFLDAQGEEHQIWSWSHGIRYPLPEEEWETHFGLEFPLADYYEDEVWLKPHYSHLWQAENEIIVTIQ